MGRSSDLPNSLKHLNLNVIFRKDFAVSDEREEWEDDSCTLAPCRYCTAFCNCVTRTAFHQHDHLGERFDLLQTKSGEMIHLRRLFATVIQSFYCGSSTSKHIENVSGHSSWAGKKVEVMRDPLSMMDLAFDRALMHRSTRPRPENREEKGMGMTLQGGHHKVSAPVIRSRPASRSLCGRDYLVSIMPLSATALSNNAGATRSSPASVPPGGRCATISMPLLSVAIPSNPVTTTDDC